MSSKSLSISYSYEGTECTVVQLLYILICSVCDYYCTTSDVFPAFILLLNY